MWESQRACSFLRKGFPGNATVTFCHSRTPDLENHTRRADIIIAAIGKPQFVTKDMVKEGATVIDVGINRIEDSSKKSGFRLVGDVDFEQVAPQSQIYYARSGWCGANDSGNAHEKYRSGIQRKSFIMHGI